MPEMTKTTRLEARISPQALAIVRHAAELQGRSVSDFVTLASVEAAQRAIEDAHIIRLSVDDQRRFAEVLIDPPALSPAMRRGQMAHQALIRTSAAAPIPD